MQVANYPGMKRIAGPAVLTAVGSHPLRTGPE